MKFELINLDNLDLAVSVQNKIFPTASAKENYLEMINHATYRKEQAFWLVYNNDKVIGVSGLYSYHEYPDDAWLGWFGVLEEERHKGYALKMLQHFEDVSRKKGYSNIRLYTDEVLNAEACLLYENFGMIKEKYSNPLESDEINNAILIFSKSLHDEKVELWNNKFLELTEQVDKQ